MRISFVVPQNALMLGIVGPYTVFSWANKFLDRTRAYEMEIIARKKDENIVTAFGLKLVADNSIEDNVKPIDTALITGPLDVDAVLGQREIIAWVKKRASSVRRIGSVCTGAFILASAGLLDGRRATTHWGLVKTLMEKFPAVKGESNRLFIRDGNIWSSAGMTAGIDLALAMVEEDHGREVMQNVAREMMITSERQEAATISSVPRMTIPMGGATPIEKVQMWIVDHIAADLSVKKLAQLAGMSVRNFTRVFQAQSAITPARFVDAVRVDAARRLLEGTRLPLKKVAMDCGFISITRMRRAFYRHVGISPQEYRQKLASGEDGKAQLKQSASGG